jgi:hypothetical protein
MTVTINASFDVTQREFIADIAWATYKQLGYTAPAPTEDLDYFFRSQHPQEQAMVAIAEEIFEMLTGDSPSYDDDPEEDDF